VIANMGGRCGRMGFSICSKGKPVVDYTCCSSPPSTLGGTGGMRAGQANDTVLDLTYDGPGVSTFGPSQRYWAEDAACL